MKDSKTQEKIKELEALNQTVADNAKAMAELEANISAFMEKVGLDKLAFDGMVIENGNN